MVCNVCRCCILSHSHPAPPPPKKKKKILDVQKFQISLLQIKINQKVPMMTAKQKKINDKFLWSTRLSNTKKGNGSSYQIDSWKMSSVCVIHLIFFSFLFSYLFVFISLPIETFRSLASCPENSPPPSKRF